MQAVPEGPEGRPLQPGTSGFRNMAWLASKGNSTRCNTEVIILGKGLDPCARAVTAALVAYACLGFAST